MRRLMLAAVCLVLFSLQTEAQTIRAGLRGLASFSLVIEELDRDASACGLTKEGIERAVMYPASSAKFQIEPLLPNYLYVVVSTMFLERYDECVSVISLRVRANQKVTLAFSGQETVAPIELWTRSGILASGRGLHAQRSSQTIEDLTKAFVTDWNLANK